MSEPRGINRRLPINVTPSLIRRLWSRVDQGRVSECWEWQAGMRNGYGAIKHEKRVLSTHRVAYVVTFGEPAEGTVIAHKCDNPKCCKPRHLEAVSPGKNNRDARGRLTFHFTRGEDSPNAVMDGDLVRKIVEVRRSTGLGARGIAQKIGVAEHLVKSVIEGRSWKHITGGKVVPS